MLHCQCYFTSIRARISKKKDCLSISLRKNSYTWFILCGCKYLRTNLYTVHHGTSVDATCYCMYRVCFPLLPLQMIEQQPLPFPQKQVFIQFQMQQLKLFHHFPKNIFYLFLFTEKLFGVIVTRMYFSFWTIHLQSTPFIVNVFIITFWIKSTVSHV